MAVVTDKHIFFVNSQVDNSEVVRETDSEFQIDSTASNGAELEAEDSDDEENNKDEELEEPTKPKKKQPLIWNKITPKDKELYENGVRLRLDAPATIDQFTWHTRGDYFAMRGLSLDSQDPCLV